MGPLRGHRKIAILFWILAYGTIPILWRVQAPPPGWDLKVYANAVHSLRIGHDPYADGVAAQRIYHEHLSEHDPYAMPPYTYVYSPLTLPAVWVAAHLPKQPLQTLYWMLYWISIAAIAWVCVQWTEPEERGLFEVLAPAAMFFPGLVEGNVLLSGNLAYILYGLVFVMALRGWRHGKWLCFYLAVVVTSCFKAPMLTLLVIPALSARRQWMSSLLAAGTGLALFVAQPMLCPALFRNYLEAVGLQFSYNHDFGLSPAGLLGNTLFFQHLPYSTEMSVSYAIYGGAIFATLVYLSRLYFDGTLTLTRWAPVLVIGTILLNPRVKEYDVAPLALPLALVGWRVLRRRTSANLAAMWMALVFLALNSLTFIPLEDPKPLAGSILVASFGLGIWDLACERRAVRAELEPIPDVSERSPHMSLVA